LDWHYHNGIFFNQVYYYEGRINIMDKTELFMIITFCTIIFGTLLIIEKGLI